VLVPLTDPLGAAPDRILQGIFPLPEGFSELASAIEQAYFRYENVSFLRQRLQQSFVLILSLVLGITALMAILLAFNAARRLVRPIRDLARATELMRGGEFPETLSVASHDELGFLVESFNDMATELETTQREMTITVEKTGRSSVFNLAHDYSTALFNNTPEMILQGQDIPIHLGSLIPAMKAVHGYFEGEGQMVVDTDPSARSALRTELRPRGFSLVVVQKDGSVGFRRPSPRDVREIVRGIDNFQFRQEELRSGGQ